MNFKLFGRGPITGLEQRQNVLLYVLILAGPFYVIWGLGFILDSMGAPPEWVVFELVIGIAMWGAGTYGYHAKVKMEVAGLKAFNSAKVRFDENTVKTLDLIFADADTEYIGKTSKGREIWRIGPFTETFSYEHPTEGWISFNRMFVTLPFPKVPWGDTFLFGHEGELWFKSIPCESPNCEGATFHLSPNWMNQEGEWIPVALVAECWQSYMRAKEAMLKFKRKKIEIKTTQVNEQGKKEVKTEVLALPKEPVFADEIIEARLIALNTEITNLKLANKRLEEDRQALLDENVVVDEIVDDRLGAIKRRHRNILRAKKPMRYKFLNMKTGAVIMALAIGFLIVFIFATGGGGV